MYFGPNSGWICRLLAAGSLVLSPLFLGSCANEPLGTMPTKAALPNTKRVGADRYSISFQTAPLAQHPGGAQAAVKGGGFTYISGIRLTVDGQTMEIPTRACTDLGDPMEKTAKLGQSADGYVLQFSGGDGAEAYMARFILKNGTLAWRRITWVGPDDTGLRLMSHYKDTWYAPKR